MIGRKKLWTFAYVDGILNVTEMARERVNNPTVKLELIRNHKKKF